jgi:hypothetical protein
MRAGWAAALVVAGLAAGAVQAGASHGAGEGGARPESAPYMPLRILPQGPVPLSRNLTVGLGSTGAPGGGAFGPSFAQRLPPTPGPHVAESARPGAAGMSRFDLPTDPHPSQAAAPPDRAPLQGPVPPALALLALTTAALGLSAVRDHLRGDALR